MKNKLINSYQTNRYFSTLISHFSFQNSFQRGFTLIELLVVMTIFLVVGGIVVSVLFISFRGSSKSEIVTTVKDKGSFALSQMIKTIRYAESLDVPQSCVPATSSNSITFTSVTDGAQTTYSCPADINSPITSNSATLIDTSNVSITSCSFTCSQQTNQEPPRVTIQFTLTSKTSGLLDDKSIIPFQSSVILRNAGQ